MAWNGRTVIRIAAVVVVSGFLAWNQFGTKPPALSTPAVAANTAVDPPSPVAPPRTWKLGSLTLTACELARPNSGLSTAAWCAQFPVPENRADPHSRRIALKLAVLRSAADVADANMLVFLAGGPGQAATDSAGMVASVLKPLLAHHNVLLLDQRGTGGSNPLSCKEPDADVSPGDEDSLDAEKMRADAADCLKQVEPRADPRYYTTTIATRDLEDVRQALGSPPVDLIGVSYGTRMAQQYLRRYPDAVRSMVLDSVVPNPLVLGEDFSRNLEQALKAQFARCTAQPACRQHFGDPYQTLYQLR
ncbi:MAG: alpha/beta hydrolase, partial [Rhodanobacter sp.]|nr:alpha/beta hydrolase [Rhodanobacter sp.]